MKLSDYDYELPKELIAQYPAPEREKCRLMVVDRASRSISHRTFEDLTSYLKEGDCLVLNDTKVIPARLFGRRRTGGKVEIFVLEKKDPICEVLLKPCGRLKTGERITLESGDEVEVLDRSGPGRFVKFNRPVSEILNRYGHVPLPPYIDRVDAAEDKDDYQTIYADKEGATASPTAGLHFTRELLNRLAGIGIQLAYVTLHTSYGTFAPVKTEDVESHKMHAECFELPAKTVEAVRNTKKRGGKVFAVGTTSSRVLETCAEKITDYDMRCANGERGYTDLYIYPGYEFKVVDHLITNFHLPKSTLLLLVSAIAGRELILESYRKAVSEGYRFFSYGDAMLIL